MKQSTYDATLKFINEQRKELGEEPLTKILQGAVNNQCECPISRSIQGGQFWRRVYTSIFVLSVREYSDRQVKSVLEVRTPLAVACFIQEVDELESKAIRWVDPRKLLNSYKRKKRKKS